MPKTPKGAKRPADVIANAVHVMRIATGEIVEDHGPGKDQRAVELGRKGGKAGGKARAAALTQERRKEIAERAAKARWSRQNGKT